MEQSHILTLPELVVPNGVVHSPLGNVVVPGHRVEERTVEVEPARIQELIHAAREAAQNAYAPYSNFHVGAAVVMADDPEQNIFTGANVENSSFGATNCAERSALFQASNRGFRSLLYLAVSTVDALSSPLAERSPCGTCRQTIREFASDDSSALILIDTADPNVLCEALDLARLLPHGFRFSPSTK